MDSLLIAVVVIAAILFVLLLVVPEGLERLARRNRAELAAARERLASLTARTDVLEAMLAPYRQLESAHYAAHLEHAQAELAAARDRLDDAGGLTGSMRLPATPRVLLLVQHYAVYPQDAAAIMSDSRTLRRAGKAMAAAGVQAGSLEADLETLKQMPKRLADEQRALNGRLSALVAALDAERAAGITRLDDLHASLSELAQLLDSQTRRLSSRSLADVDAAALALESASEQIVALEQEIAAVRTARLQLDEAAGQAAAQLATLQGVAKGGGGQGEVAVAVSPLLGQAASLLSKDVPAARSDRRLEEAARHVATAGAQVRLAGTLLETDRLVRRLEAWDAAGTLTEETAALRRELSAATGQLAGASDAAIQTHSATAAGLLQRARAAEQHQQAALETLQQQTAAERDRMSAAWAGAQKQFSLLPEDGLHRQYVRLMRQFDEVQGRPRAMDAYVREAVEFQTSLREWTDQVSTYRQWMAEYRAGLPAVIDGAIEDAGDWTCLQAEVEAIQQQAADFGHFQGQFDRVTTREEAYALMDQLDEADAGIQTHLAQLADQGSRLRYLMDSVQQMVALSSGLDDLPWQERRTLTLRGVEQRIRQAKSAASCEDAHKLMSLALELANNLVL